MEYIESGYIESGYFETSIVGIQGEAAIVASFSVASELFDISDGGNDYLDATYVNPGYFEYVAPAAAVIEGNGVLLHNAQISVTANKIVEGNTQGTFTNNVFGMVVTGSRNLQIDLVAYSIGGMTTTANKLHGIVQTLVSTTQQTANGGTLVLGEAGSISNTYVDSDYIVSQYFAGTLTGGLVSFFTQSALVGKRQQGVIGNLTNDYVAPTYIDGGYFFGVSDVIITATLVGDLELVETGFIEGSAFISTAFTSLPVITRQRNGVASFAIISNMAPAGFRTRENTASFEIQTQSQSTAQRARSTSSSIETQSNISTINSRIRGNVSTMSAQFQTTTFGQRARAIDLYAFTNGGLVAQASVIRNSNTLANTFFNVGTDFIRTRNVSAEGDATVFISNIPTRIRASNIETQNAFSFASTTNATRRISQSFVASFNSDNQFSLTRGATANLSVNATLSLTPNVTRAFDSAITSTATQTLTPSVTRNVSSSQSVSTSNFCVISAIYGADMIAYDFASMTALVGVRLRGAADIFSVPGFALRCDFARARTFNVNVQSSSSAEATAIRIHPFVANPFSSQFDTQTTGVRIKGLFPRRMDLEANIIMVGVVRFYFFPTDFSFNVADEPLANTLTSRTRETGVNI
jgi:hypothetical protein